MSSNALTISKAFHDSNVRLAKVKDEVVFNASDVLCVLGMSGNAASKTASLTPDKYKVKLYNKIWFTEKGVLRAVMRSDLPAAEEFQDWVYDVIISVRKTGMYLSPARKRQMLALVGLYDALDAYYIYSNNNRLKHLVPKAKESVKYASKALDKLDFSIDELNCVIQGWIQDEVEE